MTDDVKPKSEVRVIAPTGADIFKNVDGGRSSYGALIMTALTGLPQSSLHKRIEDHIRKVGTTEDIQNFQKAVADSGEIDASLFDAEDQFFLDYIKTKGHAALIAPPITPERLQRLVLENNTLEPCIAAMVQNVAGTGYKIVHSELGETDLEKSDKEARKSIEDFFAEVYPKMSFLTLRRQLKRDKYETGNSYMVVERNFKGEIGFLRRAPSKSMRLVKKDDPLPAKLTVVRGGKKIEIDSQASYRRFAQKIGTKLIYYKEFGCPWELNRLTGEWAKDGQPLAPNQRAHEIIHEKDLEDVRTPYGVPRWITQLPSVIGSRMAEEHNLAFFQSGGVPPVMIFISGSTITDQTQQAINAFLAGGSAQKQRGVAFEIPSSGNLDNERPAAVQVERFGAQDHDSTFENYLEKNELRIRSAFRLGGIFLGKSDSYNFATAHASYVIAEAQVFKPEREEDDELFNMTVMREVDDTYEWQIQSNPLTVQDVNLQLRGLEMIRDVAGVGVGDFVEQIGAITDQELSVSEGYDKWVFDGKGGVENSDSVSSDGTRVTPEPAPDAPPPPTEPPDGGGRGSGTPAGETPEAPSPGVTSPVQNREARVLAARIARSIRDYEASGDPDDLDAILSCKETYETMDTEQKKQIQNALGTILYTSPFLAEAAMSDVATAYAMCAFAEAELRRKKERAA